MKLQMCVSLFLSQHNIISEACNLNMSDIYGMLCFFFSDINIAISDINIAIYY